MTNVVAYESDRSIPIMNRRLSDADKDEYSVYESHSGLSFHRRRIRNFTVVTMTSVLWFQIMMLLVLQPVTVQAVGGNSGPGNVIPPPPPPPPRQASHSSKSIHSNESSFSRKPTVEEKFPDEKSSESKNRVLRPPPPPPTCVSTFEIERLETATARKENSKKLKVENGWKPPPPPPQREIETIQSSAPMDDDVRKMSSKDLEEEIVRKKEKTTPVPDKTKIAQTKHDETITIDNLSSEGTSYDGLIHRPQTAHRTTKDGTQDLQIVQQPDPRHEHQSQPLPRNVHYHRFDHHNTDPNVHNHFQTDLLNPRSRPQKQTSHRPQHSQQMRMQSSSQGQSPISSSVKSTIKGLWGKVERRLDDLANLEDSVAGRAQQLVNTAMTTASTASKMSPSTLRSLAESGAAAVGRSTSSLPSTVGHLGNSLSRKQRVDSTTIAHSTSVPLQPYGQKYEIAREEKERKEKERNPPRTVMYNGITTNGLTKTIAAKGGATSSPYQPPPRQPSSSAGDDGRGREETSTSSTDETVDSSQERNRSSESFGSFGRGEFEGNRASWDSRSSHTSPAPSRENASQSFGHRGRDYSLEKQNDGPNMNDSYPENVIGKNEGNQNARESPLRRAGVDSRQPREIPRPIQPYQLQQNNQSRNSRVPWDTSASSSHRPKVPPASQSRQQLPNSYGSRRNPYDDDFDVPSWKRTMQKLIPPVPSLSKMGKLIPRIRLKRRSSYSYDSNLDAWDAAYGEERKKGKGIFGFFKRSGSASSSSDSEFRKASNNNENDGQSSPISKMLSRSLSGTYTSLLTDADVSLGNGIGRNKAILDVMFVVSIILGARLLPGLEELKFLPRGLDELTSIVLPKVGEILNELMKGSWAVFAFLYAYLFRYIRDNLLNQRMDALASTVASSVKEESEYAQLYLRLMAAIPMNRNLSDTLAAVSKTQVASIVSNARLKTYVWIVLASLTFMTVSAVGPILMAFSSTFTSVALLQEWRHWPIQWESLLNSSSSIIQSLFHTLESHTTQAIQTFAYNPMQFSFHLSMFGSLLLCTFLPVLEERRALAARKSDGDDLDDDDEMPSLSETAEEWSRLGTSSASRLSMLSENGSVESALARWRVSHSLPLDEFSDYGPAFSSILRFTGYCILAAVISSLPVAVSYFVAGQTLSLSNKLSVFRWDSLFDLSVIQLFLFGLVYQSLQHVMKSSTDAPVVRDFQTELEAIKDEVDESSNSNDAFQVMSSISPAAGIFVRDLWAAHATKRAWAIRGANLQCKNGEIMIILGDDGSGKTRLLTTIAEALTFPPKRTVTTNKVRGFISVGNLEVSKWNRKMLKRRLGILLSDVRMVADSASLFSGWTMEEILEPVDGPRTSSNESLQRTYSSTEKSAMLLALKITGLYEKLLPRLPSKTSTIFTANEEDLRQTSLKPRSVVLSPGEWSKLILAKVLAQTIYDNDNALASNDKIDNSLVGSVLLLDEPTTMFSEVDEGQLYRDLRLTGAATVITSNKWASGRFADHVCVMKNGSVVEMGSHNELLARGPQQSLYAAKWQAMTMQ